LSENLKEEQVWDVLAFYNALYGQAKGLGGLDYYSSQIENKNLIDLNNNPRVPSYDTLRSAISNYKNSAETLQDFSEFMSVWDSIYAQVIDYKVNLLAFDRYQYCINATNSDLNTKEYKDDVKRVNKFFEQFNLKLEGYKIARNILKTDTFFVWLRDSYGSFDDDIIDIEDNVYNVKKTQDFALQMMPQEYCKITGSFPKGYLWDFNLNYFNNANVNIENFDPSLRQSFNEKKRNGQLKSFINSKSELNNSNNYNSSFDGYIRTKVNNGAWVFKYNVDNFNSIPPLTHLLKSVFNNDIIERLQKDKDMISAYGILAGEMKTKKDELIGTSKDAFTIDPTQIGALIKLAKKSMGQDKIKQLALPLEDIKMYQFNDNNASMSKNQYVSSAKQGVSASSMIYSSEKMGEFEVKSAMTNDYNSIANVLYPQLENFLNFFVNKKTKKFKFSFKVKGSTLPFLRKDDIDNHIKLSDKGLQVSVGRWGSLLGYEPQEYEALMREARYGDMQDLLFLTLNSNTTPSGEVGNQTKDIDNLSDGGSVAHEYT
jgi:hypothetical protein